jgi:hypothetical protein
MRTNIFDRRNQVIGYTVEDVNQIRLFDQTSRLIGYYNKQSDQTHTRTNQYFGRGNQLLRLLS